MAADQSERRAHVRQRVSFRLCYEHRNGGAPVHGDGCVLNIGRAGALVRIDQLLVPGRELAIDVTCPGRQLKAQCEVVHVRRIDSRLHELGLWFRKVESSRVAGAAESAEATFEPLETDDVSFPELTE